MKGEWPKEVAEQAKKLRQEGHTARQIAKVLGYSRSAVIGKLNRMGVMGPARQPRGKMKQKFWTPERLAGLAVGSGFEMTAKQLAVALGTTEGAVKVKLYEHGLSKRQWAPGRVPKAFGRTIKRFTYEEDQTIIQDYANYMDVRDIAQKLGRDYGTVRGRILHLRLRRSSVVMRHLSAHPEMRPILDEKGERAFTIAAKAYAKMQRNTGPEVRRQHRHDDAARVDEIIQRIDSTDAGRELKMHNMRKEGATLERIGQHFGVSREWVRQVTDALDTGQRDPETGKTIPGKINHGMSAMARKTHDKRLTRMLQWWAEFPISYREQFLTEIKDDK